MRKAAFVATAVTCNVCGNEIHTLLVAENVLLRALHVCSIVSLCCLKVCRWLSFLFTHPLTIQAGNDFFQRGIYGKAASKYGRVSRTSTFVYV